MLSMDYLTLVNQVLTRINQPNVTTVVGATGLAKSVADKLKLIVDQLSLETDWWVHLASRTISTVAGTQDYALAADFLKSVMLLNTTGKIKLEQVYPRSFEVRNLHGTTGVINIYTVEEANYRLLPTPASVLVLRDVYWRAPKEMVANTDKPDLPREVQFALVEQVTGSVNEDLQQFEKADRNRRGFREALSKVMETNSKRIHDLVSDELSILGSSRLRGQIVQGEGIPLEEFFF